MQNTNTVEKPMGKTANLNVRIDADLKLEFTRLAKREDRSTAYLIEQVMRDRLAFEDTQIRAIQIGMEQADRGEMVQQAAVKEWVDSLGTANELPMPTSNTHPV